MLDEMKQVAGRLRLSAPPLPWEIQGFIRLHELFLDRLERIQGCREYPHVMRILAEENVECLHGILERYDIDVNLRFARLPYWKAYLGAIEKGLIPDAEYRRYKEAKKLACLFLENSYIDEDDMNFKRQRYAYALSAEPMPDWFITGKITGWMEEIITAYCFLWFSVMDFISDCRLGVYGKEQCA